MRAGDLQRLWLPSYTYEVPRSLSAYPLEEISQRHVVEIKTLPEFNRRRELEPTQLRGDVLLPSGVYVDRATGRIRSRSRSPVL